MIPNHFSQDVVGRCWNLIDTYYSSVQEGSFSKLRGPFETTFLLAMAMPMIVLPVERLIKPKRGGRGVFITEDAELIDGAGIPIRCVFDEGAKLADAPFYHPGWARVAKHKQFPVGRGWPRQASAMFDDRVTVDRAAETTAWKFITDLRNALSHGAINYLDGDGRSTDGHAAMLGFASTVSETDERLNLMRITQLDFLDFLRRWAIWCGESGVRYELDRLSLAA